MNNRFISNETCHVPNNWNRTSTPTSLPTEFLSQEPRPLVGFSWWVYQDQLTDGKRKMENRKQKNSQANLFSPQIISARLSARTELQAEIDSHVEFLRSIDLNAVDSVKENEMVVMLWSKLTLNGLLVLMLAMNQVPRTYSMRCGEFQGFLLRTVLIHEIVTACCNSCSVESLADMHFYVNFLEKHCTQFLPTHEVLPPKQLWKLCESSRYRLTKFLPLVWTMGKALPCNSCD